MLSLENRIYLHEAWRGNQRLEFSVSTVPQSPLEVSFGLAREKQQRLESLFELSLSNLEQAHRSYGNLKLLVTFKELKHTFHKQQKEIYDWILANAP